MLAFEWQQDNTFWDLYFINIEAWTSEGVSPPPQNDKLLIRKWSFQLQYAR